MRSATTASSERGYSAGLVASEQTFLQVKGMDALSRCSSRGWSENIMAVPVPRLRRFRLI